MNTTDIVGARLNTSMELPFLRPKQFWREESGVLYFSAESPGRNADDWVVHLTARHIWLGPYHYVRDIVLSPAFRPTRQTYTIAVMREHAFPKNATRADMDAEAERRGFKKPSLEIACMIRDMVTSADLALMHFRAIVTMHEPAKVKPRWEMHYDDSKSYDVGVFLMAYEFEGRSCLGAHMSCAPILNKNGRGFVYVAQAEAPSS